MYKTNEIINKLLLVGDTFVPEMHLRQPGFTYSTFVPFTKNEERIKNFMKSGNTDFIYKIELDKACFQHDMVCGKSKDLVKRTQSDKVLRDKAFKIASNPKYDDYQRGLASMVYKCFDKKSKGSGITTNEFNYELANELHKPAIKKFKKRKVCSSFKDNIWGVDLADMQPLSKFNKGLKYLLCAIDLFGKYAWVIPIKDKKGTSIVNAFKKIISEGQRKPNKIWVDQGSEFYNNTFKDFLKIHNTEMYSTYNEGKSVVAERFIRTLKNKIFKHMTTISKNVYIDSLNGIVNRYNNTVYKTIKKNLLMLQMILMLNTMKIQIKKGPKFKVNDHVRISKYQNIFAKGYVPNWSKEVFIVNEIKNTIPWTYAISDLNDETVIGTFYEKELQKTNQNEFRIEKVLKRKGDKLYVKWKGYDNSFKSWINKKDIV